MFIGEHRHNLDDKGRLQLPSRWRARLADGLVVTKGFDGALSVYPMGEWQGILEHLQSLPQADPASRAYVRQTLAGAVDIEPDSQGRFVLPPFLRSFAGLEREVVVAGLGDHLELWGPRQWDAYQKGMDISDPAHTESLKEAGI